MQKNHFVKSIPENILFVLEGINFVYSQYAYRNAKSIDKLNVVELFNQIMFTKCLETVVHYLLSC